MDALHLLPTVLHLCPWTFVLVDCFVMQTKSEGVNDEELWCFIDGNYSTRAGQRIFSSGKKRGGDPILSLDCRFVENLPPPIFFYNKKNNTSFIRRRRPVVFLKKKERKKWRGYTHMSALNSSNHPILLLLYPFCIYNPFHYCSSSISYSFIISYAYPMPIGLDYYRSLMFHWHWIINTNGVSLHTACIWE